MQEAGGDSKGIEIESMLHAREESARTAALDRMQVLWRQLENTGISNEAGPEATSRLLVVSSNLSCFL